MLNLAIQLPSTPLIPTAVWGTSVAIDKDRLEAIRQSQFDSWEKNKGVISLPKNKPQSLAQSAGPCQPRSLKDRFFSKIKK